MLAMSVHKNNCSFAVLQLAPLKSVFTQMQHPMPAMLACNGNLHHIALLQPAQSCPPIMIYTAKLGIQVATTVVLRFMHCTFRTQFKGLVEAQQWGANCCCTQENVSRVYVHLVH